MAMINILEMDRLYSDQWVLLDRSMQIVDHGPDMDELRARNGSKAGRCTFFRVAGESAAPSRRPRFYSALRGFQLPRFALS